MIIGTAGHIDHGKTTLVKALTGVDCDRLKEEKDRGITVDLGYAYTPIPGATAAEAAERTLGFIDVPGHEKLIHNMLAGATGIDFVLLVVAADDGPMPQTREHLEIVNLLGLRRAAVALTKCDLVAAERLVAARAETQALLAGTPLADAPIFPVDALSGKGIAALRAHLDATAQSFGTRACVGRFRLAIDRAFSLTGIGTVVTGTAFSGRVRNGETLTLSPGGKTVRIRSLRVQDTPSDEGRAGQRIALALAGIEKGEIRRGQWLVAPALHAPVQRVSVALSALADGPALAHWTQVHCHLGADDIPARIGLLSEKEIAPGESGFAELILERETSVIAGDRLILRDASARRTVGGGLVLDIFPPSRKKRTPERLALLNALADPDPAVALCLSADAAPAGIDLDRFALNRNLDPAALSALCQAHGIRQIAGSGFAEARWRELGERVDAALSEEHTRNPDMAGVERDRLRRLTLPTLARPAFDALIGERLQSGLIAQTGAWLHRPEHRLQLAEHDRDLWRTIRPLLDAAPYNPPRVRDIAQLTGIAEETVRRTLKAASRVGSAYPVAHDHYFTAAAVDDLARRVSALCHADGIARAARLRDEIGGGRKVAIHILEFFDRIGFTRRVRDNHALRATQNEAPPRFLVEEAHA